MCTDNRHASEFFQNFSFASIREIRKKPDFLFLPFVTSLLFIWGRVLRKLIIFNHAFELVQGLTLWDS